MTDFAKCTPEELARVTTRDGRKVRVLCVDGPEPHPIAAWIDGYSAPTTFAESGLFCSSIETHADLILPPEPRVVWLLVWSDGSCDASRNPITDHIGGSKLFRVEIVGDEPTIERVE